MQPFRATTVSAGGSWCKAATSPPTARLGRKSTSLRSTQGVDDASRHCRRCSRKSSTDSSSTDPLTRRAPSGCPCRHCVWQESSLPAQQRQGGTTLTRASITAAMGCGSEPGGLARDVAAVVAVGVAVTSGAVPIADEELGTALFRLAPADIDGSGLGVVLARQRLVTLNAFSPLAGLMDDFHVTFGHPLHLPAVLGRRRTGSHEKCVSPRNRSRRGVSVTQHERQQASLWMSGPGAVGRFRSSCVAVTE